MLNLCRKFAKDKELAKLLTRKLISDLPFPSIHLSEINVQPFIFLSFLYFLVIFPRDQPFFSNKKLVFHDK